MPGTFTTDLVPIQLAEDTAMYVPIGGLKAALATNDDYLAEGALCLTFGPSSTTGTVGGSYHLGAKCLGVASATISAGGSGYVVGEILTVSGGIGTLAAQAVVATLTGSAVATVTVAKLSCGHYTTVPTNPASTTSNLVGTGCTLTLTTGGLNYTGGGLHIFTWIKCIAWPSMAPKASGGMAIIVSPNTTMTTNQSVLSAVVANGGTSGTYLVNDTLTVSGGTGTAAQVTVVTVSGSQVATVTPVLTARGAYTTFPTNPASTTGGGGSGCTLTLTTIFSIAGASQWFVGGSNTNAYEGWVPYVVGIDTTPDLVTGTQDLSSIDLIGIRADADAVMKLLSVVVDRNSIGTGSTIVAGTGRAPVTMSDYQVYDNAKARAWGVAILSEGIYFLGGKLYIGTTTQAAETIFIDKNQTYVWHDFPVASGFYEFNIKGASGQETTFQLGNYTPASGLASNGVTIKGAGNISGITRTDGVQGFAHSIWVLTASAANQVTKLYSCTFSEMLSAALAYNTVSINLSTITNGTTTLTTGGSFDTSGIVVGMLITGTGIPATTYVSSIESAASLTMSSSATDSTTNTRTFAHNNEVRSCTFTNFGTITTNGCVIDNCTFQDVKTGAPISATSAVIVASSTAMSRITNCKFINCSGASNGAIRITAAGSYDFTGLTFSGNTFDIENSSAGVVTINADANSDPTTFTNTGGGSTSIINTKTIAVHVEDTAGVDIANAQVYIQKSVSTAFTSGAGNTAGNGTLVVTQAIDSDIPQSGMVSVHDVSANQVMPYRYASWATSTFTFPTAVTGTANAGGSATTLIDTDVDFTALDIEEGDTIQNTTDTGAWAVVDEIVSATELTTSALQGGGTNLWSTGNGYSFHKIAVTLISATDTMDVPLVNLQTDVNGEISKSYNYGGDLAVKIRVRSNAGATKYIPFNTAGTIKNSGLTLNVVLQEDTEAT